MAKYSFILFVILLVIFEIHIILKSAIFVKHAYIKSVFYYNRKLREKNNNLIKLRKQGQKIVRFNTTQLIDTRKIAEQIGFAELLFIDKEGAVKGRFKLHHNKTKIGRAEINDIVVPDRTVSREQCIIVKTKNASFLYNISKSNDTIINGIPVKDVSKIEYGDVIEIGTLMFRYEDVLLNEKVL